VQGVDGQPQPEHVLRAAQPGSQFIQLEMGELQMAEGSLVQGLCMFKSASQPDVDRGLSVAEDPPSFGRVQPFGKPQTGPLRPDVRGGSNGTTQCRVEH